jgi:hypothetical protein
VGEAVVAVRLFAVIPTVGERNDTLFPMCRQLEDDGVTTLVVYNRRDPGPNIDLDFPSIPYADPNRAPYVSTYYWAEGEPVNLSKVWNIGLHWAEKLSRGEEYVVAVFNDDLTLPPGIVQQFAWHIEHNDTAAAFAASPGQLFVTRDGDPLHLGNRMCGFAFALLGSKGIRADESLLWWWGDTDLDIQARKAGGVVGLPMPTLVHHDPNGYTNRNPELTEQAGRDRETFQRKHGFLPW